MKKIKTIKKEIRILGIDDGYFRFGIDKYTLLIGVVMRGGNQIDGVLSERIQVDGNDVTEKIISMVTKTKHYDQLRLIMLSGITFAGFNIADIKKIYDFTELPIIVIIRKYPNFSKFKLAMKRLQSWEEKWKIIEKLERPKPVKTNYGIVYYQKVGISDETAKKIIKLTAINAKIPEPVRVAHLIAMGVTRGYSKGKP